MIDGLELIDGHVRLNGQMIFSSEIVTKFICGKSGEIVLMLETNPDGQEDNNVLRIDVNGKVLWRIKSGEYPYGPSPVNSIYFQDDKFFVYRDIGIEEEIDLKTGTVLDSDFIK